MRMLISAMQLDMNCQICSRHPRRKRAGFVSVSFRFRFRVVDWDWERKVRVAFPVYSMGRLAASPPRERRGREGGRWRRAPRLAAPASRGLPHEWRDFESPSADCCNACNQALPLTGPSRATPSIALDSDFLFNLSDESNQMI